MKAYSNSSGGPQSTRLYINNLVEFYFPIKSKHLQITSKQIEGKTSNFLISLDAICIDVVVDMPCSVFSTKIQLDIEDIFNASEDFTNVFQVDSVHAYYGDNFKESLMIVKTG